MSNHAKMSIYDISRVSLSIKINIEGHELFDGDIMIRQNMWPVVTLEDVAC